MNDVPQDPRAAFRAVAAGRRHAVAEAEFAGADLSGVSAPGGTLRRLDLAGARLSRADLSGTLCGSVRLAGAWLEQADLSNADLSGADLSDAHAGQVSLSGALLEDAVLDRAGLRFAHLQGAVLDGASLVEADAWGAVLTGVTALRACLRLVRLDEAKADGADLSECDLSGASLRRADLSGACLRAANLRDVGWGGTKLTHADLSHATLPFADLTTCDLAHVRLAGAWLERTRLAAAQLGGMVGEERAGEWRAAYDAYTALELNFRSLGRGDDESWAYRRRRRMGKRAHRADCLAALRDRPRRLRAAGHHAVRWLVDGFVEWLCDYGESLARVLRACVAVLLGFAALYWLSGGLQPRADAPGGRGWAGRAVDYLLYSLDSMTTVGPGQVALRPVSELAVFLSSAETVLGTVLIGLFGFVLGARMRR